VEDADLGATASRRPATGRLMTAPTSTTLTAVRDLRVRHAWADNLRVLVIAGMIVVHVATAYLVEEDWYYVERAAGPVAQAVGWGIVGAAALFGMGLLFLVAGWFTPRSLARKGPGHFAVGRLLWLGVPLKVFVFVIDLLTDLAGYRGMGGTDEPAEYLGRWWREDADLGPAWFIATLLVFSLAYAAWRASRPSPPREPAPLPPTVLVLAAALIAAATFAVRLLWPLLSDDHFGLNLWEFPQMLAMFGLGVVAAERGWLDRPLDGRLRRRCGQAALLAGLAMAPIAVGIVVGDPERFAGGWHPQAVALPLVEGVLAVGMSVWAFEWFRRRWDHAGSLAQALGRASYATYLVHPPIVVGFSLALRSVALPGEVKFVLVAVASLVGAFAVGWLLTRCRLFARVL
jgi:glucans biosynthesis protein C